MILLDNKQTTIGFLLIDEFSMIAFASAIEPLRTANRIANLNIYKWDLISHEGNPVFSSNGLKLETNSSLNEKLQLDILFVCSGLNIKSKTNSNMFGTLRKLSRQGMKLGAICTGTYLLAKAGLLSNRRCTIHWENNTSIREEFSDLDITNNLFEIDKDRFTCSGGTSALDMMLNIISKNQGHKLAKEVSDQLIHERIREPQDFQRMDLRNRLGVSHPKIISSVKTMEENLEEPLSQVELSKKANISLRQLERLFKKYLLSTPTNYYLKLRLEKSRYLLLQTSMSILSVALACGFISASHFSKCYRDNFGISPRAERFENTP